MPGRRWGYRRVVVAVTVCVHAAVLLSAIVYLSVLSAGPGASSSLQETKMMRRLTAKLEQIIGQTPKRSEDEVAGAPVQQTTSPTSHPPQDETMKKASGSTPPPPDQEDEDEETRRAHKPWRMFLIPEDHIFVVDCAGDEPTVHIKPRSDADADDDDQPPITCVLPSLFDGGWYRALFWPVPAPEGAIIVPASKKVIKAILKDNRETKKTTVQESMRLSPDLVMFYRAVEGSTEVLIASRDYIEYLRYDREAGLPPGGEPSRSTCRPFDLF